MVPGTADAKCRFILPEHERHSLATYLRGFQLAHVDATGGLFDCLTCRVRVERHRTELSII
jgi:hypothetical protein